MAEFDDLQMFLDLLAQQPPPPDPFVEQVFPGFPIQESPEAARPTYIGPGGVRMQHEVRVDPAISARAVVPIQRMLEIT